MLSIIVSTHNRPKECRKVLDSLLTWDHKTEVEILVIDSNSNKPEKLSLQKYLKNKNLKYIFTSQPGLSIARNLGWQKARGEYVAYIDDDAVADRDWVKNILAFIKQHPKVKVFGGPFTRHSQKPIPFWLPKNYGTKNCGRSVRSLKLGRDFLNGTNMVYQRSLLRKMGGFNPAYGMVGSKVYYGEETELQLRLAQAGIEVWYDPNIKVSHLVADRKMNLGWIIKEAFITGLATRQMMHDYQTIFEAANKGRKLKLNLTGNLMQKAVRLVQLVSYLIGWHYQRLNLK